MYTLLDEWDAPAGVVADTDFIVEWEGIVQFEFADAANIELILRTTHKIGPSELAITHERSFVLDAPRNTRWSVPMNVFNSRSQVRAGTYNGVTLTDADIALASKISYAIVINTYARRSTTNRRANTLEYLAFVPSVETVAYQLQAGTAVDRTVYTPGDGIDITTNTVSIDLAADSGLEFDGGDLRLNQFAVDTDRDALGVYMFGRTLIANGLWRNRWWIHLTSDETVTLGAETGTSPYETITFGVTNPVPDLAAEGADANKVLKVAADGMSYAWAEDATGGGGATYTEGNGIDISNSNVLSVVGHTGITVDANGVSVTRPVPTGGTSGQVLKVGSDGTSLEWAADNAGGTSLPAFTSGNAGQVLKVNSQGTAVGWASDTDSELPSYSAGNAGQVLKVQSNGTLAWNNDVDTDTTYTGGDGITVSNSDVISVDAHHGITVDANGVSVDAHTGITVDANGVSVTRPVPTGGAMGQVLKVASDGSTLEWANEAGGAAYTWTLGGTSIASGDAVGVGEGLLWDSNNKVLSVQRPLPIGTGTGTDLRYLSYNPQGGSISWQRIRELPNYSSGNAGQIIKVTSEGTLVWAADSGLPAGGTAGQVLTINSEGNPAWAADATGDELPSFSTSQAGRVLKVDADGNLIWDVDLQGASSLPTIPRSTLQILTTLSDGTLVWQGGSIQPGRVLAVSDSNPRQLRWTRIVPEVTSSDTGKVLKVQSDQSLAWDTDEVGTGTVPTPPNQPGRLLMTFGNEGEYHWYGGGSLRTGNALTYTAAGTLEWAEIIPGYTVTERNRVLTVNAAGNGLEWLAPASPGDQLPAFAHESNRGKVLKVSNTNTLIWDVDLQGASSLPAFTDVQAGRVLQVNGDGDLEWGFAVLDREIPSYDEDDRFRYLQVNQDGSGLLWNRIPSGVLPSYTPGNAGQVLKVNADGDLEWGTDLVGTGSTTYTAAIDSGIRPRWYSTFYRSGTRTVFPCPYPLGG